MYLFKFTESKRVEKLSFKTCIESRCISLLLARMTSLGFKVLVLATLSSFGSEIERASDEGRKEGRGFSLVKGTRRKEGPIV